MKKLEGKTALITGSDSGIGQATAVAFAKEGANVVITYHTDEEGAQKTLEMVKQEGMKGMVVQIDVSEESEVEKMFDDAIDKFGTVDSLMNNAALNGQGTKVEDLTTQEWDTGIKTKLYGYFFCIRSGVERRKDDGGKGKIR